MAALGRSLVLLVTLIAGCAGVPPAEPPAVPMAWAQQAEERGLLPVGRVVAIERWWGPGSPSQTSVEDELKGLSLYLVSVPVALVTAPVVLATQAAAGGAGHVQPDTHRGNVFRHRVRLTGTQQEVTRDEFWSFRIGDCVMLRLEPRMLVPALPDQCEA